jgi:hypothetical protein
MMRKLGAVAVLGLGLVVFGAPAQSATAVFPLLTADALTLRKQPPDGPSKPPKPKRLPSVDTTQSLIDSVDIG